jgi:hypothetical protein
MKPIFANMFLHSGAPYCCNMQVRPYFHQNRVHSEMYHISK